jgi:hypothetical protein
MISKRLHGFEMLQSSDQELNNLRLVVCRWYRELWALLSRALTHPLGRQSLDVSAERAALTILQWGV